MATDTGDLKVPIVVAVCISNGGIPKLPVAGAEVQSAGLVGDAHAHAKHVKPDRAVSLMDEEVLREFVREGYAVGPGIMGENLTVRHLHVQELSVGDRLQLEGGPLLELTEPRKPCFVLDAIDPQLKHAAVGRCGYLARVLDSGQIHPGQRLVILKTLAGQQAARAT